MDIVRGANPPALTKHIKEAVVKEKKVMSGDAERAEVSPLSFTQGCISCGLERGRVPGKVTGTHYRVRGMTRKVGVHLVWEVDG